MHHHGTKAEPKDLFNFNLVFKIDFTPHATLSLHYRWHQKKNKNKPSKTLCVLEWGIGGMKRE